MFDRTRAVQFAQKWTAAVIGSGTPRTGDVSIDGEDARARIICGEARPVIPPRHGWLSLFGGAVERGERKEEGAGPRRCGNECRFHLRALRAAACAQIAGRTTA